ncbi:MAG: hypothetical protein V3W34_03830 [Phycisphaerae bacterium]
MNFRWLMIVSLLAAAPLGCMRPPPSDEAELLPDTDNDGFFEPELPDDIISASDKDIRIELINNIAEEDLTALIGNDILALAAGFLTIEVEFDITLSYESGDENPAPVRRELGRFTISLQFPCPDSITVTASVQAIAPFGLGTVLDEALPSFVLTRSDDGGPTSYVCGQLVSFVSSTDEGTGEPTADFTIEDFIAP